MQKNQTNKSIDMELMESIIAQNVIMDEVYLASIIDVINPKFFENKDVSTVINVVTSLFKQTGKIPNATEIKLHLSTQEQKMSFKRTLEMFKILDSAYDKKLLYENTEYFLKERAVYHAIKNTITEYSKTDRAIDPSEVLQTFENACNISIVDNLGLDVFSNIDDNFSRLEKTYRYLSSGYPWLDKVLGGGFLRDGRALYIFSGVTNSGKSIILGNLAVKLIQQNNPIIIISMEMSEDVYFQRIVGQLTKIPLSEIKKEIGPVKEISLNHITSNPNGKLFIKEFSPNSVTVNHISAYIKRLCNKKQIKPAAIIVDYVNLIQPTIQTGNTYIDIKRVAEQLRGMSYLFECPVISATQLGRNAIDVTDPGMEHTSESIGLSMTADFQAAIWCNDSDKELGIIHMGIQKNRFGLNYGKETFRICYDNLTIEQMKEDYTSSDHVGNAESSLKDMLGAL